MNPKEDLLEEMLKERKKKAREIPIHMRVVKLGLMSKDPEIVAKAQEAKAKIDRSMNELDVMIESAEAIAALDREEEDLHRDELTQDEKDDLTEEEEHKNSII